MDPLTEVMKFLAGFVSAHPYVTLGCVIGAWLLSNVVSAMPSPDQSSGKGYKFLFALGHGIVGSIPRIWPSLRLPSDPTRSSPTFFGKGESGDQSKG